jgi:hypothetical protein
VPRVLVGANELLLTVVLLCYAVVAPRSRLPLAWAGAFVVLGLATFAQLMPYLHSFVDRSLLALLRVAGCFLLAGAVFSTPLAVRVHVPSAAAPQP